MVHVHNSDHPPSGRGLIRLAPGIKLSRGEPSAGTLSVLSVGKVHLNQNALAILELCDGSRSRDRVVVDAIMRSAGSMRAADVAEFLDAAQARGWIMEVA
jgi:hypothetical protein